MQCFGHAALRESVLGRQVRTLFFLALLAVSALIMPATSKAEAGEASVAIPIPAALEEGLERAGIRVEARRNWLDQSTIWIAGSIIIAGIIIAYAIRRKKA